MTALSVFSSEDQSFLKNAMEIKAPVASAPSTTTSSRTKKATQGPVLDVFSPDDHAFVAKVMKQASSAKKRNKPGPTMPDLTAHVHTKNVSAMDVFSKMDQEE
eukprot:scaffold4990_cov176-Amphora_coffeaeformis.AAC.17